MFFLLSILFLGFLVGALSFAVSLAETALVAVLSILGLILFFSGLVYLLAGVGLFDLIGEVLRSIVTLGGLLG